MLRRNTIERIKVLIKDGVGNPVTGLVAADFKGTSIFLYKSSGAKTTIALTLGVNLFELDSTDSPGIYEFVLSASNTDTLGELILSIQPMAAAFESTYFFDSVEESISSIDLNSAVSSIKGANNIDISQIAGGAFFNAAQDNLHVIKQSILAIPVNIASSTWDETMTLHNNSGTMGELMNLMSAISNNRVKIDRTTHSLKLYAADNVTVLKSYNLYDITGQAADVLASERMKGV